MINIEVFNLLPGDSNHSCHVDFVIQEEGAFIQLSATINYTFQTMHLNKKSGQFVML
jgi:hypothetical protein